MRISLLAPLSAIAFLPAVAGCSGGASVHPPDESGAAVEGVLVDSSTLRPLARRTVWIAGRSITTDAEGAFSFPRVATPYDAIVIDPDGSTVSIFRGLSRRDPVLPHAHVPAALANVATLSGDVSGGGNYPLASTDSVGVYFFSDDADDESSISGLLPNGMNGPGYGPMYLNWGGADSLSGQLMALGTFKGGDGNTRAWFVDQRLTLKRGQTAFVDVALAALPKMKHVKGFIDAPYDATIVAKEAFYKLPIKDAAIGLPIAQGSGSTFDDEVPDLDTLNGQWCVGAVGATGSPTGSAVTQRCGVAAGDNDIILTLENPPAFTTPQAGDTLDADTRFAWSAFEGGVHLLELAATVPDPHQPSIDIYTSETSAAWPDLGSMGGAPFPKGASYDVTVVGIGPYASMDDAFGPMGFAAPFPTELRRSDSSTLYLTTGP